MVWFGLVVLTQRSVVWQPRACSLTGLAAVLQVLCGVPAGVPGAGLPAQAALDERAPGGAGGVRAVPAPSPAAAGTALPRGRRRQPAVRALPFTLAFLWNCLFFSFGPLFQGHSALHAALWRNQGSLGSLWAALCTGQELIQLW